MINKTKILKKKKARMLKKEKRLNQAKILNDIKTRTSSNCSSVKNDLSSVILAVFTAVTLVFGVAFICKGISVTITNAVGQPAPIPPEIVALHNKIKIYFPHFADEIFKSNKLTAVFVIYASYLEIVVDYAKTHGYTPEAIPKLHGLTKFHFQDWGYRLNCWQHSMFYNITLDFLSYNEKKYVIGVYEYSTRPQWFGSAANPKYMVGIHSSDYAPYEGHGNLYPVIRREEAFPLTELYWNELNLSKMARRKVRFAAFENMFIYPHPDLREYSVFKNMPNLITQEMSQAAEFEYLWTDYNFIRGTATLESGIKKYDDEY